MTEEYFYHYTDAEGATAIFLSGKILPSLAANGDAVHGDGVYLTTLDKSLGKDAVGQNNWNGVARKSDQKMTWFFEILLPSIKVRSAKAKRDIQVFSGELHLSDYKWTLNNWEGVILATQLHD